MLKIGILGRDENLLGFGVLGITVFCVQNSREAEEALCNMKDFGLIFLSDDLAEPLSATISEMEERGGPVFLFLPDSGETESVGQNRLRRYVEKAVGADITKE